MMTLSCRVEQLVTMLMGTCVDEFLHGGLGPTATAAIVNRRFGVTHTPIQVWELWLRSIEHNENIASEMLRMVRR